MSLELPDYNIIEIKSNTGVVAGAAKVGNPCDLRKRARFCPFMSKNQLLNKNQTVLLMDMDN